MEPFDSGKMIGIEYPRTIALSDEGFKLTLSMAEVQSSTKKWEKVDARKRIKNS